MWYSGCNTLQLANQGSWKVIHPPAIHSFIQQIFFECMLYARRGSRQANKQLQCGNSLWWCWWGIPHGWNSTLFNNMLRSRGLHALLQPFPETEIFFYGSPKSSNISDSLHCVQSLSCVQLFVTPWTGPCQASPSTGFSRQKYCSGFPFPSPGNLPDPGIKPTSLV